MLKNRLKDLNSKKLQGKSIEMINQNELSKIKGGLKSCPSLSQFPNCPNLTECGTYYYT